MKRNMIMTKRTNKNMLKFREMIFSAIMDKSEFLVLAKFR